MTFDEQEVLRRFHRALVREIQAYNPENLTTPFSVSEIYQNLVPYRTHRDELGVEMNADYEYALLRLLAGEGDFLSIESMDARKEIREELDSPNPNTGLYRDFAAADVHLNPDLLDVSFLEEIAVEAAARVDALADARVDALADIGTEEGGMEDGHVEGGYEGEGSGSEADEEYGGEFVEPESEGEGDSQGFFAEDPDEPPVFEASEEEILEGADEGEEMVDEGEAEPGEEGLPHFETCPWCKENLPQRNGVKFCPFCGSNVQLVPCPACGEELELSWRFCIACGTEVPS